jgi:hypothetical protein
MEQMKPFINWPKGRAIIQGRLSMKNVSAVSFAIFCLILSACGTTAPDATTTPVKVTVTGNSDISPAFARDVQDAARLAIMHYAPHARPMTVSLVLNGATSGVTVVPGTINNEPQFRTLGTAGMNAAEQGALPVVPVQPPSIAGQYAQAYVQLRGTYAITDANGRVVESKPLQVSSSANERDGEIGMRRDLILRAGELVAFRVKALSH